jgi:hypothetical protein
VFDVSRGTTVVELTLVGTGWTLMVIVVVEYMVMVKQVVVVERSCGETTAGPSVSTGSGE